MKFLYTFKYFNKHYNKVMLCEFSGSNEQNALNVAVDRINWVDSKYIEKPYTPEEFSLVSFDKTIIQKHKSYITRNGLRVEINSVNLNSTTDHNQVTGKYWRRDKNGKELLRGTHMLWSINGRAKFVGTDDLDLVESVSSEEYSN